MRVVELSVVVCLAGCAGGDGGDGDDGGGVGRDGRWNGPITQDNFGRAYGEVACTWSEQCSGLLLDDTRWESCVEGQVVSWKALFELDTCDFDQGAAEACIDELPDTPCDPGIVPEACQDVCGERLF